MITPMSDRHVHLYGKLDCVIILPNKIKQRLHIRMMIAMFVVPTVPKNNNIFFLQENNRGFNALYLYNTHYRYYSHRILKKKTVLPNNITQQFHIRMYK